MATGCQPVTQPQLGGPVHRVYIPGGRVAQL
jgi:hypothetical protein